MKKTMIALKIFISISLIPLWFIKLFHGVGHLPSQSGEIVRVDFYHSMIENLSEYPYLIYISIALLVLSAALSIVELIFKKNRWVRLAALVAFVAAVLTFITLFFLASSVGRGY